MTHRIAPPPAVPLVRDTVPYFNYETGHHDPTRQVRVLTGEALEKHLRLTYQTSSSRAIKAYMRDAGIHPSDVFEVIGGIRPERFNAVQVRTILTNDQLLPFFGATTEDGFRLGFNDIQTRWEDLIAATVNSTSMSFQWYLLNDPKTADDYALVQVAQGADIPVATVTVSGQHIILTKKGKGIEWSDEALDAPVALAQLWLRILGIRMGMSYWRLIGRRLINGYLPDGTDAPVIVMTATAGVFTLGDLRRAKAKLENTLGFPLTDIVLSGDLRITLETATVGTNGNLMVPDGDLERALGATIHENEEFDNTQIAFLNRGAALMRIVNKPFATEDARNAQRQVTATYASMIDNVIPATNGAVVILDSTP